MLKAAVISYIWEENEIVTKQPFLNHSKGLQQNPALFGKSINTISVFTLMHRVNIKANLCYTAGMKGVHVVLQKQDVFWQDDAMIHESSSNNVDNTGQMFYTH